MRVVAQGFAVGGLEFGAKVPTAGLLTLQRIEADQFTELEEVRHPSRFLQRLVESRRRTRHFHILPEFRPDFRDPPQRALQPFAIPRHAAFVPHYVPELLRSE